MTYYNYSPYDITVRVAGATAHEFVIPACAGCPTYSPANRPSCSFGSRNPSHRLSLRPGDYVSAVFAPSRVSIDGADEEARPLRSGYEYVTCYFVTSTLAGIGPI